MASANSYDDEDEDMMMTMMMQGRHGLVRRDDEVKVGDVVYKIPPFPAKYKAFLQSRRTIYREIAHMHKLTGNSISGHAIGGGHPNVLKLYDVLEYVQPSKSTIFLVLELAAGGELFDRIRGETGVDESLARNYFSQLLSGVLFCHSLGIVHRDLKPENLLLSDSDVLKIADFGLSAHFIAAVSSGGAAALSDESSNDSFRSGQPELDDDDDAQIVMPVTRFRRLNSVVGSPHYVAPEILQNSRYGYDGRKADMWSIGVILYSLLAGSLPFGKDLQTCPRYLKFCEWIRSLPSDPQTGKLTYDATLYQHTPALRIATPPAQSATATSEDLDSHSSRFAQVHPNSGSVGCVMMQQTLAVKPTVAVSADKNPVSSSGSSPFGMPPSGRRGSRVVAFPSWLFPAKLTPQAVYLMASLLHPEPGKRFSCEDACRSQWVAGGSL
ncbi:hypothetical protein PINS_up010414 [Pythium insidiosum]|nr:hypothetical protein PINS_up010414 [Pythium insidiosum]